MIEEVWSWLPSPARGCDARIVFSTSIDGYSLTTLMHKTAGIEPLLLLVRSEQGNVRLSVCRVC
jgi:hypothetical protein